MKTKKPKTTDKTRLDWVEKNGFDCWEDGRWYVGRVNIDLDSNIGRGKTLREAIDDAMRKLHKSKS